MAAEVETFEPRVLLSSIVVGSMSGGQNYAANVTVAQLDPTHTAVTLRDAVDAANNTTGADTISFDSSVFPPNTQTTIVLAGGTPLVLSDTSGATTISAPGAAQVAVSGANLSTVLVVNSNVTAVLSGLTIEAGKGSINLGGGQTGGGGIFNNGNLNLQNMLFSGDAGGSFGGGLYNNNIVVISGSTFTGGSAQFGGGFFNGGTATVTSSTIAGNSATSQGAGFYNLATVTLEASTLSNNSAGTSGGGFYSNNTVNVVDSTIAGNSAGTCGGGFINLNKVTLIDSTVAGNFASQGGGVYNMFATVKLTDTIVAQNFVSPANLVSSDWGQSAADPTSSYNLIGDGTNSGLVNGTNHNLVGTAANLVNPMLAPLANNGGPTLTMALLKGSVAIDAGGPTPGIDPATGLPLAFDQRGAGFSRTVGAAVDIGAFEAPLLVPVTPGITTPSVVYGQHGLVTVTVTPSNATGSLSLFVDGSATAIATYTLAAGDSGSHTFDVGILNAGTHTLHAVFTATGNFLSNTADGSLVVNKANALVSVSGYSGTYDAKAHGATGTVTGVAGDSAAVGSSLNLGASFTNFPGGTAHWVFSGGNNYNDQSGDVSIAISKANAIVNVSGFTGTYDSAAHGATGTVTGVGSDTGAAGASLNLGASFTNATTSLAHWIFTGGTNYNDESGDVSIAIAKATASVNISAFSHIFDGAAHGATGSVAGVGSDTAAAGSSLNLGATFTNAPGGIAHWTFSGGTNYNDQSGDVAIVINKADAFVSVSGFSSTFDGTAHGATGTVTGVGSDTAAAGSSLNLGASFTNAPGGTAHWVFSGGTNYNDQSGDVSIKITARTITVSITASNKVADGTTTATISGTSLTGLIAGDVVTLTVGAANFASANVGTWTVTATGLALSGAASGNYVLASTTAVTTASITGTGTGNGGTGKHHHDHGHHHHKGWVKHDHDGDKGKKPDTNRQKTDRR